MSQSSARLSLEAHFDFVCLFNNYIANMADQFQVIKKSLSLTVFYKNYPSNRYVNKRLLEDLFQEFLWINMISWCYIIFCTTSHSMGGMVMQATWCGPKCLWTRCYVSIGPRSCVQRSIIKISITWAIGHRSRPITCWFEAWNEKNIAVN